MLNELDKELEARGLDFVRYADDCIISLGSNASANRVMASVTKWIEKKLKYLGYVFWKDKVEWERREKRIWGLRKVETPMWMSKQ